MARKVSRKKIQQHEKLVRTEIDKLRDLLEQYGKQESGKLGIEAIFETLKDLDVFGNDPIDPFSVDLAQWVVMASLKPLGNDPIDPFGVDDFKKLALTILGNDPIDPFKLDILTRISLKMRDVGPSTRKKGGKKKPPKKGPRK